MPRKPPKISDGLRAKFKAVAHDRGVGTDFRLCELRHNRPHVFRSR